MDLCGMDFFGGVARIARVAVVMRTQDKLAHGSAQVQTAIGSRVNFFLD